MYFEVLRHWKRHISYNTVFYKLPYVFDNTHACRHTLPLLITNQYAARSGPYRIFIENSRFPRVTAFSVMFCEGMPGMIMEPVRLICRAWAGGMAVVLSPGSRKC